MKLFEFFDRLDEGRKEQFIAMLPKPFQEIQNNVGEKWEKKWLNEVNWALTTLKKQDRIVWYLRFVKAQMLSVLVHYSDPAFVLKNRDLIDLAKKELKKFQNTFPPGELVDMQLKRLNLTTLKSSLEHYLSLNLPGIEKIVWGKQDPPQLVNEFAKIEQEWKESRKAVIPKNKVSDTTTLLIEFPNSWQWVNLNTASCSIEGQAMGHCGNTAGARDTDTILSLREPVKGGWKPHLTFILDKENGYLGEMKGRNNDKPATKYHPSIIALLELPIIKGINGGGYAPEHNFSVNDLTKQQQDQLFSKKPQLAGFLWRYRKEGKITTEILNQMYKSLKGGIGLPKPGYTQSSPENRFILLEMEAKNKDEYDQTFRYYYNFLEGNEHHDFNIDEAEVVYFLDSLPDQTQQEISDYVIKTYKEEIENQNSAIVRILNENADELYDTMRSSVYVGWETGTHNEIYKAIKEYLEDPCDGRQESIQISDVSDFIHTTMTSNQNNDLDAWGTEFWIKPELMCALIDSGKLDEYESWWRFVDDYTPLQEFESLVPSSGFNDYSNKSAIEYFFENQNMFTKSEKKK